MKKILLLLALLSLPALAVAGPDDDARAALALAAAKIKPVVEPIVPKATCQCNGDPSRCDCPVCVCLGYTDGMAAAKRLGKPVVVFVGVPARKVAGCIVVSVASSLMLPDGTTSAIIVSDGDKGDWLAPTATDAEIRAKAFPPVRAVPTQQSYAPVRQAASC